jgi:single-stranded-DNA-specific exonuclease
LVEGEATIGRKWVAGAVDEAAVERVIAAVGCPDGIARLLVARGIREEAKVKAFLAPSLNDLIDPMRMLGMKTAVERIQRAVRDCEPILIYGDYDVDGTTATVLLKTAIERIAAKDKPARVRYHVPHRIREGYGMQTGVLADAAAAGVRLVISVDTGIRAFAAATEAKALGLDLIVTDHHLPDDARGIPEAVAVINPAQPGCGYPFKGLCGAAVAFKLAHAILRAACESDSERERLERTLVPSFLKLVAIATIADSVPLDGENRVIAALGLRELRNPVQAGLRALMEVAQIPVDRAPTATEVGFRIAPRINAAGRMDVASDVVELFLTRDVCVAAELAAKLNRLNDERRATEARALEAIDVRLEEMRGEDGHFPALCFVMDDPEWHRGVLGILASRIVDRTGRPALVLTHEDGQAHGSGRSIDGYHLLDALTEVHGDGEVFTRFGGHAHAVGFSLPTGRVALLRERMNLHSGQGLAAELLALPMEYDVAVSLEELTPDFYAWIERCGPFGIGNREPLFMTCGVTLTAEVRPIKERHVCLQVVGPGGARFSAVGWSRGGREWTEHCREIALRAGSRVDLVYRLRAKTNPHFPGLELELVDARISAN